MTIRSGLRSGLRGSRCGQGRSRTAVFLFVVLVGTTADALAQGPYVAASFFGEIVRTSHTDTVGLLDEEGGGEAVGWAARVGTPLGAIWGVDAEFARPSRIERDLDPRALAAFQQPWTFTLSGGTPLTLPDLTSLLPTTTSSERHATLSTSLWIQQTLTSRFSLVYHGGVAFVRTEREVEVRFPRPLVLTVFPTRVDTSLYAAESVIYSARPFVGVESPIALTRRAYILAGVRLHGIEAGWIVRPSVGVGWNF